MTTATTFATDALKEILAEQRTAIEGMVAEINTKSGAERDALAKRLEAAEQKLTRFEEKYDTAERASIPGVEVGKRGEKGKFSFGRWCKMILSPALQKHKDYGYEMEVAQTMRDRLEHMDQGFKTAVNAATDTGGAFLIPMEAQTEIIPELEAASITAQLGVQQLQGAVGLLRWTKDNGGISAAYIDTEAEETGGESVPTFEAIEMRPHTIGVFVPLTKEMMEQPGPFLEPWLRSRMGSKLALREDLSVFLGTGSNSKPRGVFYISGKGTVNWASLGDGSSAIQFGRGSGKQNVTYGLRAHVKAVAAANALQDATRPGWAASVAAMYAITNAVDTTGNEMLAVSGGVPTSLIGYPVKTSTQLDNANAEATAAGFTSTNEFLCFGDWGRVLNVHWGTLAFAASDETETNFRKVRRTLRMISSHDVGVTHDAAFAFSTALNPASSS